MLRALLGQDPSLNDVRISLGLNQQKLGDHADAVESFREVLKRAPTNALAHFDLAVSYFALHRLDDALKEFHVKVGICDFFWCVELLLVMFCFCWISFFLGVFYFFILIVVDLLKYVAY